MERPIILKAHEVRGILENRQTQLRRIVKPRDLARIRYHERNQRKSPLTVCPFGQVGDHLWGRETWWTDATSQFVRYKEGYGREFQPRWKSPVVMPRWASRILLEIVSVRVERLQDISEADARTEGIERLKSGRGFYDPTTGKGAVHFGHFFNSARAAFEQLWIFINGEKSWSANPWVWVVEFKRVDAA